MPKRLSGKVNPKKTRKLAVTFLGKAKDESRQFLNPGQCLEVEDVAGRLEDYLDADQIWDLQIDFSKSVGGIGRLIYTGMSLCKKVVEIYFAHIPKNQEIVVLGVFEFGDQDGSWLRQTRMQNRLNHYMLTAH